MAWPVIIAAVVGAAASIYSGIKGNQDKKSAAQKAHDQTLAQWHRQNRYNDPSAQMSRLKQAGLNPNMVYGTGTQAAGNSSSSFQAPVAQHKNIQTPNIPETIAKFHNIQRTDSQTANNIQQTANLAVKEAILGKEQAGAAMYYWNRAVNMHDTAHLTQIKKTEAEHRLQFLSTKVQNEFAIQGAKVEFETVVSQWAKAGIAPSDPAIYRLTYSIMKDQGLDPSDTMLAIAVAKEAALLITQMQLSKVLGKSYGSNKIKRPSRAFPKPKGGFIKSFERNKGQF